MHSEGVHGPLIIGATPSVIPGLLPLAISILTKDGGRMNVTLVEGVHDHLLLALRSGELDVIVGPVGGATSTPLDIIETAVVDDPYQLAVRRDGPLFGLAGVALAALHEMPWVLPPRGTPLSRQIEAHSATA